MKTITTRYSSLAAAYLIMTASATAGQLSTDAGKQCAESVRRCFDFAEDSRVTCLYQTQELKICENSTAKPLVELRLGLGSSTGKAQRQAYMVDGRCVEKCDYQFVRALIGGELDEEAGSVRLCYENCKVDERRPMLRP